MSMVSRTYVSWLANLSLSSHEPMFTFETLHVFEQRVYTLNISTRARTFINIPSAGALSLALCSQKPKIGALGVYLPMLKTTKTCALRPVFAIKTP